jgi:hypothetical protein
LRREQGNPAALQDWLFLGTVRGDARLGVLIMHQSHEMPNGFESD